MISRSKKKKGEKVHASLLGGRSAEVGTEYSVSTVT
jgi:hypothetical protein